MQKQLTNGFHDLRYYIMLVICNKHSRHVTKYIKRPASYKLLVFLLIQDCPVNETPKIYLLRTQHAAS